MYGVFGPENVPVGQSVDFKKSATRLALSFAETLWANPRLEKRKGNNTRTSPMPTRTFGRRQLGLFLIGIRCGFLPDLTQPPWGSCSSRRKSPWGDATPESMKIPGHGACFPLSWGRGPG